MSNGKGLKGVKGLISPTGTAHYVQPITPYVSTLRIKCPSVGVRTMSTPEDSEGTPHVAAVVVHLFPRLPRSLPLSSRSQSVKIYCFSTFLTEGL